MKKFTHTLLLSLVQGTLAFRGTSLAAPKRDLRLQTTVTIDGRGLGRSPWHPPTWQAVVVGVPDEVLTGIPYVTLGLNTLLLAGVDLPGIPAEYGPYVVAAGIVVNVVGIWLNNQKPQVKIQMMVQEKLKDPYDPPPSNPWTGNATWTQEVEKFVTNNAIDTTLVLVDPTGTAKRNLIDPTFRDQIHVVAPALDELSLKKGISQEFDLKDTKGLGVLAGLIKVGIKFPFGSGLLPAKLIIKVPSTATTEDIVTILSDVNELKEKAGANIIPIVTVESDTFVGALSQSLRSALQVLS